MISCPVINPRRWRSLLPRCNIRIDFRSQTDESACFCVSQEENCSLSWNPTDGLYKRTHCQIFDIVRSDYLESFCSALRERSEMLCRVSEQIRVKSGEVMSWSQNSLSKNILCALLSVFTLGCRLVLLVELFSWLMQANGEDVRSLFAPRRRAIQGR